MACWRLEGKTLEFLFSLVGGNPYNLLFSGRVKPEKGVDSPNF
jgi:hypothetical protein